MSALAIIPARGGSKGIPGKNMIDLGGKPLIEWTVEAAQSAHSISRVIVTTDDNEIADFAKSLGADVPFLRPSEYAEDNVHAVHAILHTLTYLETHEGHLPEFVAMLLATAPLRTAGDIDACAAVLDKYPDCSAISVHHLEHYLHQMRRMNGNVLEPVINAKSFNTQRQDAEPLYAANGAIFMCSTMSLRKRESFHHPGARAYVMPRERSIDIDTEFDLRLARHLVHSATIQ